METKEILGIIAAIIVVIVVIGVLSMVQGKRAKNAADSLPELHPVVSNPVTTTTNIWDQIHAAQATTVTEETGITDTAAVQTDENGSALPAETDVSGETTETTAVTDANAVPADPFAPQPAETEPEEILPAITEAPEDIPAPQGTTVIVLRP